MSPKPYDPRGAINVPRSRLGFVRNDLMIMHRVYALRDDHSTLRVERQCRIDTGLSYTLTKPYQPISLAQTVDMIKWWMLLDKLGFDLPSRDFAE